MMNQEQEKFNIIKQEAKRDIYQAGRDIIIQQLDEKKKTTFPLPPHLFNQTPPEPNFVGRTELLNIITEWYKTPSLNIGALIGWGGEGKSAIVRKWYDSIGEHKIKPEGIFWWGFYRNPYLERFLDSLLNYFAAGRINLKEMKSTWAKVDKIKEVILDTEYLIILDGLEEMQEGYECGEEFGCMSHRELSEIIKYISDFNKNGLLLITSRYPLTDIKSWEGSTYQKIDVERLNIEEGRALFGKIGVNGTQNEIDKVIEEYKGHALSLTLLSMYLVEDFKGNIKKARYIPPFYSDREAGGKAHRILLWYEKQLTKAQKSFMKIFPLFRRYVHEDDFKGVFRSKMDTSMNRSLREMSYFSFMRMVDNLYKRRLITKGQDSTYTTHPLIKNYFDTIFVQEDKKLCHKRIYQYIGEYAPDKPQTLEEMKPLFEQVYHGCAAGYYDDVYNIVYKDKLQRQNEFYLVHKLGAWETVLSLISNFFPSGNLYEIPKVSIKGEQAFLFNEAGLALLNLGRPSQAEALYQKSIEFYVDLENWAFASVIYRNLADLQFRIGKLIEAIESSKNALKMAIESKHKRYIQNAKAYLGYILFLSGNIEKARNLFKEAEEIFNEFWPDIAGLYSIWGIFYADFLCMTGNVDEASIICNRNLEICIQNNWVNSISRSYRSLCALERIKGNYNKSIEYIKNALDIAYKVGMPELEIDALIEKGRVDLKMENYSTAKADIINALRHCDRTGFKLYEPDAEAVLANIYHTLGDNNKAMDFANSAYKKSFKMNYYWPKIEVENILNLEKALNFTIG